MFLDTLKVELNKYNLLNHPFYQKWSCGHLNIEILKVYAALYYHQVETFPNCIALILSQCLDMKAFQVLLDNLNDEAKGEENHPELWLQFAEGLGVSREEVKNIEWNVPTKELVEGFFDICKKGYAYGLGALYAYERQVPEIAISKIDGLKKFYNIDSEQALKFFNVHIKADEWHSEECENLIDGLNSEEKAKAREGANVIAKLLWKFLDGVDEILQKNMVGAYLPKALIS